MSDSQGEKKFLRCFCSRSPILAVYGVGKDGEPFVHIKSWKQHKVFVEALFKGGTVSLYCRECIRWHVITIRSNTPPRMTETQKPVELEAGMQDPVQV